jgi:hypothetical protein
VSFLIPQTAACGLPWFISPSREEAILTGISCTASKLFHKSVRHEGGTICGDDHVHDQGSGEPTPGLA